MKTIKQLAEEWGTSYEAIRKLIARHKDKLAGHIVTKQKTRYLDEYAVEFLKQRRRESPVVVTMEDQGAEIEALRAALEQAREQITELQAARIRDMERITTLQAENAARLEDKAARELAEARAEDLRIQREEARAELSRARAELEQFTPSWFGFYRKRKGTE